MGSRDVLGVLGEHGEEELLGEYAREMAGPGRGLGRLGPPYVCLGSVAVVVRVVAEMSLCLEDEQIVVELAAGIKRVAVVRGRAVAVASDVVGDPAETHPRPAAAGGIRGAFDQLRRVRGEGVDNGGVAVVGAEPWRATGSPQLPRVPAAYGEELRVPDQLGARVEPTGAYGEFVEPRSGDRLAATYVVAALCGVGSCECKSYVVRG